MSANAIAELLHACLENCEFGPLTEAYTARPHSAPPAEPVPEAAAELFAGLGEIAERTTLASSGWSGNRIDRVELTDGRALIAKRIVPAERDGDAWWATAQLCIPTPPKENGHERSSWWVPRVQQALEQWR